MKNNVLVLGNSPLVVSVKDLEPNSNIVIENSQKFSKDDLSTVEVENSLTYLEEKLEKVIRNMDVIYVLCNSDCEAHHILTGVLDLRNENQKIVISLSSETMVREVKKHKNIQVLNPVLLEAERLGEEICRIQKKKHFEKLIIPELRTKSTRPFTNFFIFLLFSCVVFGFIEFDFARGCADTVGIIISASQIPDSFSVFAILKWVWSVASFILSVIFVGNIISEMMRGQIGWYKFFTPKNHVLLIGEGHFSLFLARYLKSRGKKVIVLAKEGNELTDRLSLFGKVIFTSNHIEKFAQHAIATVFARHNANIVDAMRMASKEKIHSEIYFRSGDPKKVDVLKRQYGSLNIHYFGLKLR